MSVIKPMGFAIIVLFPRRENSLKMGIKKAGLGKTGF